MTLPDIKTIRDFDMYLDRKSRRLDRQSRDLLKDLLREELFSPFDHYTARVAFNIAHGNMTYEEYLDLQRSYLEHNPYLKIWSLSSSQLGAWGEDQVRGSDSRFRKPPSSHYDLILEGVRVEVKTSRASNERDCSESVSHKPVRCLEPYFKFNFCHLKHGHCDVFVLVGVWSDLVKYWVMSPSEVESCEGSMGRDTDNHKLVIDSGNHMKKFSLYSAPKDRLAGWVLSKAEASSVETSMPSTTDILDMFGVDEED